MLIAGPSGFVPVSRERGELGEYLRSIRVFGQAGATKPTDPDVYKSLRTVSRRSGLSAARLSELECGRGADPTREELAALAPVVNVRLSALLELARLPEVL